MASAVQQWYSSQLQRTEATDSFDMFLHAILGQEAIIDTASSNVSTAPSNTQVDHGSQLAPASIDDKPVDYETSAKPAVLTQPSPLPQPRTQAFKGPNNKHQKSYRQRQKVHCIDAGAVRYCKTFS